MRRASGPPTRSPTRWSSPARSSLFWRRRAPIAVLAIVTAVLVTLYLREYGAFLSVLGLPALYAVAAHEEHRAAGVVGDRSSPASR